MVRSPPLVLSADFAEPAMIDTDPPSPSILLPTEIETAPPAPPVAAPVVIDTVPDAPALEVPVPITILPLLPDAPALLVDKDADPPFPLSS